MPKGEQLVKTLIAFANTAGGRLIVGVNDQGKLIGLGELDIFQLMDTVSSMIHTLCAPSLLPQIYIENIEGKELLVIEVFRGALLPYYIKGKGRESGVYVRLGASNRLASPEVIQALELKRLNQSYDEQPNYQQSFQSLDISPLGNAFKSLGKGLNHEKMCNLKLIVQDQGQDYPSHGLLILLGHYEQVEIKCSRFKGKNMSVFLDKKEYKGDLLSQLEGAEYFIKNHLHLKAEILGLQRTETYEIPMPAIREALVNAVLHRDYSNPGRDIKIGIYDDMLNIVSPGGLPNGLIPSDLRQGRSEIRNRVLARVFKELGYIEQWGSGIERIKTLCLEAGNPEPQIHESGDFVDWELYRPVLVDDVIAEPIPTPYKGVMSEEKGVMSEEKGGVSEEMLHLIGLDPNITILALAKHIDVSTRTIERHLKALQKEGRIKRIGPTKNGYWVIVRD